MSRKTNNLRKRLRILGQMSNLKINVVLSAEAMDQISERWRDSLVAPEMFSTPTSGPPKVPYIYRPFDFDLYDMEPENVDGDGI